MAKLVYDKNGRLEITKEMRREYTILAPNIAPIHFNMLETVLRSHGYRAVLLKNTGPAVVECGLKYVHNDTCYPALLTIGQMIDALNSGQYDPKRTALLMTQTGGGCRASNYIHLLRKALQKAGYGDVPVISVNTAGLEKNSGFKLTLPLIRQAMAALVYGDLMMLLSNQVKPYETQKGQAMELVNQWSKRLTRQFEQRSGYSKAQIARNLQRIAYDFSQIPVNMTPKVKVGIVGEIYVKYSPLGNNNLEALLRREDCEVMLPGILNFVMYCVDDLVEDAALYGGGQIKAAAARQALKYLCDIERSLIQAVTQYPQFHAPSPFSRVKELTQGVIGLGCKMGEGWLLTAEMAELIEAGYGNIVCAQPFGCLPNHIAGKGVIRRLRELYPDSNIVPVDYDPGATSVNQENRIKLMLAVARENLQKSSSSQPVLSPAPAQPSQAPKADCGSLSRSQAASGANG